MSRRRLMGGTDALMGTSLIGAGLPTRFGATAHEITLEVREVDGRPTYNGLSPGQAIYADPGGIINAHLINAQRIPRS